MKTSHILITESNSDYELLDSGDGQKLERFGEVVLSRPDPQALWSKYLPATDWKKADGVFTREEGKDGALNSQSGWTLKNEMPGKWPIELAGLKFLIKPTAFKHVGLFPEQSVNWGWLEEKVKSQSSKFKGECAKKGDSLRVPNTLVGEAISPTFSTDLSSVASAKEEGRKTKGKLAQPKECIGTLQVEVLNLFGYTGGATLACAKAGAKVVHVDGSKAAIAWARENAELSGLTSKPIRWILDDARAFVTREIKRGRFYDGIIMDPPAFGHGPDNELWKIEEHFLPLVKDCMKILKGGAFGEAQSDSVLNNTEKPSFFVINGYSAGYSAIAYENILLPLVEKYGGSIEIGELVISETQSSKLKVQNLVASEINSARLLPCGIFARWSADKS